MKSRLLSGHDFILMLHPDTERSPRLISIKQVSWQLESLFIKAGLLK
jgi:hypothetical protein